MGNAEYCDQDCPEGNDINNPDGTKEETPPKWDQSETKARTPLSPTTASREVDNTFESDGNDDSMADRLEVKSQVLRLSAE